MTGMRFLGAQEQMESVATRWHERQSVETSRRAECVGESNWQLRNFIFDPFFSGM